MDYFPKSRVYILTLQTHPKLPSPCLMLIENLLVAFNNVASQIIVTLDAPGFHQFHLLNRVPYFLQKGEWDEELYHTSIVYTQNLNLTHFQASINSSFIKSSQDIPLLPVEQDIVRHHVELFTNTYSDTSTMTSYLFSLAASPSSSACTRS